MTDSTKQLREDLDWYVQRVAHYGEENARLRGIIAAVEAALDLSDDYGPVTALEAVDAALASCDGNPEGENPKGSSPEGMPARSDEVGDARLSSSKARIETLETALEEIASDVGFLLRAIEDQDPYGELRLRVKDITKLVRDARSALRSKQEERSA